MTGVTINIQKAETVTIHDEMIHDVYIDVKTDKDKYYYLGINQINMYKNQMFESLEKSGITANKNIFNRIFKPVMFFGYDPRYTYYSIAKKINELEETLNTGNFRNTDILVIGYFEINAVQDNKPIDFTNRKVYPQEIKFDPFSKDFIKLMYIWIDDDNEIKYTRDLSDATVNAMVKIYNNRVISKYIKPFIEKLDFNMKLVDNDIIFSINSTWTYNNEQICLVIFNFENTLKSFTRGKAGNLTYFNNITNSRGYPLLISLIKARRETAKPKRLYQGYIHDVININQYINLKMKPITFLVYFGSFLLKAFIFNEDGLKYMDNSSGKLTFNDFIDSYRDLLKKKS